MFLHKVIDEGGSIFILELFMSHSYSVEKGLPFWSNVATLDAHTSQTHHLNTVSEKETLENNANSTHIYTCI